MKRWFIKIAFITASIAGGLIVSELAFQSYSWVRTKNNNRLSESDEFLGWASSKNRNFNSTQTTLQGEDYAVNYQTNDIGIRVLKKTKTSEQEKVKILVLGDSFTGGAFASNDQMWFASLQKELPVEIYAYGQPGYGTYQSFLAFAKLNEIVKPDVLLFQFCENDIGNDFPGYSQYSITRSQDLLRPYMINNRPVKNQDLNAKIYRVLYKNSLIFRRIDAKVQEIQYQKYGYSLLNPTDQKILEGPALKHWEFVYRSFIKAAKDRSNLLGIWSVSCGHNMEDPYRKAWKEQSRQMDVITFDSYTTAINKAISNKIDVFHSDGGHLNHRGNQIAGDSLSQEIKRRGLIKQTLEMINKRNKELTPP